MYGAPVCSLGFRWFPRFSRPRRPGPRSRSKAAFQAHKDEFNYLLGDWRFTSVSKQYGEAHGFWSAVRLLDRWELIGADAGTGLQDLGTARLVGSEMHLEQRFGAMSPQPSLWRIRYYDIQADRFSWTADRSTDEGRTWVKDYLRIEARRIGPARHLGPIAIPQR